MSLFKHKNDDTCFRRHPGLHIIVWVEFFCILIPIIILILSAIVPRWDVLLSGGFTTYSFDKVSEGNYHFGSVIAFSVILGVAVSAVTSLIATCTAWAVVHYKTKFRWLVELLSFLPMVIPAIVFAMGINIMFIRIGIGNSIIGVIVMLLLTNVTFSTKIMIDVVESAGDKLEEQARVLGAGPVRAFFQGVLPTLVPGIFSSMALAFIGVNCAYLVTALMGGGTVRTLATVVLPMIGTSSHMVSSLFCIIFVLVNAVVFMIFQGISNVLTKRYGKNLGMQ
jgi:putative spermidine/putrescine transport system permease protein